MLIVMKKRFIQIFAASAVLFLPLVLPAAGIKVLPADKAVSSGVLPNGMSYYVAVNKSLKGFADFALVQRTGIRTVPDSLSGRVAAAASLDSLPHFVSSSPADFLASHGCKPSGESFVTVTDDATVYRFHDVLLSSGKAVADSMLLMIADIVDRPRVSGKNFAREWYAPSDQAVIVCGDVDAAAIAEKLKMLSYMSLSGVSQPRPDYVWEDTETEFVCSPDAPGGLSVISLTWRSPRTPVENMNTVQPSIFEIAVDELALIAKDRIAAALEERDIPYANLSCRRYGGLDGPADEHFAVSVSVEREDSRAALEVLASTLSLLDSGGASMREFKSSQTACFGEMATLASAVVKTNSEYVDRCKAAFLYNGSLASEKEKLAFHQSRNVADTTMLRLFNRISSALLDGSRNLRVYAGGASGFDLRQVFDSSWTAVAAGSDINRQYQNASDTLAFPDYGPKVKIKSIKKEPVSGGEIWTFTNGFRVIYKKMPSGGNMYYSLALSGGYGGIKNLGRGEGAFMADYPDLCYIAGLKGRDFKKLLSSMDVTMDTDVNLSNTVVSGKAPRNKTQLLLRSLLAFSNERRPDSTAFSYYLRCEKLRLAQAKGSRDDILTIIDSLMCPDYKHSSFKSAANLNPGIASKAEELFNSLSAKTNDGVLVLVGDMDETALRKLVTLYAGGFRTKEAAFKRPQVRYQPLSGWLTYNVDGDGPMAVVAMSARLPMTAENYMTAPIAAIAIDQALTEAFAGTGVSMEVFYSCKMYPEERFSIMVFFVPSGEYSFLETIGKVRSVLTGLSGKDIPQDRLDAYKEYLKNHFAVEMTGPLYWRDAIVLRYLEGKDFTGGYETKIKAIDAAKVRKIVASLNEGTKVEYIVRPQDDGE